MDLDELYPGETEKAVRDIITRRGGMIAGNAGKAGRFSLDFSPQV